ncbi:helix-turn-helix domain-containing protein [Qipengyuania sp. 483]
MRQLQYPIFVTVAEAMSLLRLGRTSVYAMIKSGELTVAKFGRGTRITFSSVLECAMLSLEKGNSVGIDSAMTQPSKCEIAEQLVLGLCHTHDDIEVSIRESQNCSDSPSSSAIRRRSSEKKSAGEI